MFGVRLRVWGDYACFTRPEMKVERVSYDIITPSAARAILESIYWKPSIRWIVDRIHILKPIKFVTIKRNEVARKMPVSSVKSAMEGKADPPHLFIHEARVQRTSTVLRDVEYVIEAHFEVLSDEELAAKGVDVSRRTDDDRSPAKHIDNFRRRAKSGRCFKQPYLGTREFAAHFELLDENTPIPPSPLRGERDLGIMLYDIDLENGMTPMFFRARMVDGVVEVPPPESEEVMR